MSENVRIVVIDKDNHDAFLAGVEGDAPDILKLIGGSKEPDETPRQAAERELLEEVEGVDPSEMWKVGELPTDDGKSVRHIFAVLARTGEVKPAEGMKELVSLTLDSVPPGLNQNHITSAVRLAHESLIKRLKER